MTDQLYGEELSQGRKEERCQRCYLIAYSVNPGSLHFLQVTQKLGPPPTYDVF